MFYTSPDVFVELAQAAQAKRDPDMKGDHEALVLREFCCALAMELARQHPIAGEQLACSLGLAEYSDFGTPEAA